jgi:hypothetical protein
MKYTHLIDARVAGIPCIIAIKDATVVRGSYSYHAASDVDYYGFSEFDYDVLDRRCNPAPWLERKLNDSERERIESMLAERI